MALKHDAQGFLVGDPVDLSKAVKDWAAIRDDVRAIRKAVLGIEGALSQITPDGRVSVPVTPAGRTREAGSTLQAFHEIASSIALARVTHHDEQTGRMPWNPLAELPRSAATSPSMPAASRAAQMSAPLHLSVIPQTGGNAIRRNERNPAAAARVVAELRAARSATQRAPIRPPGRDSLGRFAKNFAGEAGPADRIAGTVKASSTGMQGADPTVPAQGQQRSQAPQQPQSAQAPEDRHAARISALGRREPVVPHTGGGAGGDMAKHGAQNVAAVTDLRTARQAAQRAPVQPAGRDSPGRVVKHSAGDAGPTDRIVGTAKTSGTGPQKADLPAPVQDLQGSQAPPQPRTPQAPDDQRMPQLLVLERQPVVPHTGGAGGPSAKQDAQSIAAISQMVFDLGVARQSTQREAVKPVARSGLGRFVKSTSAGNEALPVGGTRGADAAKENGIVGDREESALRTIADRIVGVVKESGAGMQEADPTLKAFSEVAQPMARGYGMLTGGTRQDKRQESWLRRIYGSLTAFRKEETAYSKAANKSLKALEDKPVGEGSDRGGLWGMLLPLLMRLPVIGSMLTGLLGLGSKLPGGLGLPGPFGGNGRKAPPTTKASKPGLLRRIFGRSATTAGEAGALGAEGVAGAAGKTASRGGRLLRGAGRLLRRVPWLGSLLAVGMGTFESASIENDSLTTREQKNAQHGKNWGGVGGGLAGAAAGAALGSVVPVLGTIVGGMVGAVVGEWLGSSAGELIGQNFAGITSSMRSGWDEIKAVALGTWDWIRDGWDSAVGQFGKAADWVKSGWDDAVDRVGVTFTSIQGAWGEFVDRAKTGFDSFTNLFRSAYEGLKSLPVIGEAVTAAEEAATAMANAAGKAADLAVAAKDKVVAAGSTLVNTATSTAGKVWNGAVDGLASIVPQGLKDKIAARRANGATPESSSVAASAGKAAELGGGGAIKGWEGAKTIGGKVGQYWTDAKQYLRGASDKAGVDAGVLAKISHFESKFDADAAPIRKDGTRISSAHGYGQFIDGTWTTMLNKYGKKYGVKGAGTLTKQQAAQYRGDKSIQAGMLAEFTRENIQKGRMYGGTDDDANVYAFHNLGDKDAKNLLAGMKKNPSMTVRDALLQGATSAKEQARIEKVISGNKSLYGDGNVTAADAYARMGQVMRRGEVFAADIRQGRAASTQTPMPPVTTADIGQGKAALAQVPMPPVTTGMDQSKAALAQTPMPSIMASVGQGKVTLAHAPIPPVAAGIVAPATPVVASVRVPAVSVAPSVPSAAEAPPIIVPMASGDSRKPIVVASASPQVGQDASDRRIAHIVTGGLSG